MYVIKYVQILMAILHVLADPDINLVQIRFLVKVCYSPKCSHTVITNKKIYKIIKLHYYTLHIFYCLKVIRQYGGFTENLLTTETTMWTTQHI